MQSTNPPNSTVWSSRRGLCVQKQYEEAASHSEQNYPECLQRGKIYLKCIIELGVRILTEEIKRAPAKLHQRNSNTTTQL
jgi:hypothetical protein